MHSYLWLEWDSNVPAAESRRCIPLLHPAAASHRCISPLHPVAPSRRCIPPLHPATASPRPFPWSPTSASRTIREPRGDPGNIRRWLSGSQSNPLRCHLAADPADSRWYDAVIVETRATVVHLVFKGDTDVVEVQNQPITRLSHGNRMAITWQSHANHMAITCQSHGNLMAIAGNHVAIT